MSAAVAASPVAAVRYAWARVAGKESPVIRADALTWPEIVATLTKHTVGPKDGPGFLPAAIEPGPRKGERVSHVSALALDIEAKAEALPDGSKRLTGPLPPTLASMAAELDLRGWAGILATTHSHEAPAAGGTLGPRYRLVLKLSRPIRPDEVKPLGLYVAALLGVTESVDTAALEPARLFYLPRSPAERRHLAEAREVSGEALPVDATLRAAAAAKVPPPSRTKGTATASVIDAFNATHDVGEVLERAGYKPAGAGRWIWKGSISGISGVVMLPESERVYSHHAADPLHGQYAHDTFSAWCVLNHGGDVSAAVREAVRILGMAPERENSQTFAGDSQIENQPESEQTRGISQDSQNSQGVRVSSAFDRTDAIKRARQLLAPKMGERAAPAYPVAALGPLADACEALATEGQLEPAMAAQCLLGAASLLTQGLSNVESLTGRRPLSLDLMTLGESGDGKSTAQAAALAPVNEWQRKAAKQYADELTAHEQAKHTRKKSDDLAAPPSSPYRLAHDSTVEGLRRDLEGGPSSQGLFSDEAAAILCGYGMSAEHRAKTAAVFSRLWDSGHLSVSRGTTGRTERYGCRVALHWLIQPIAAAEALSDPMLSALGFWPRFLVAWPASQAPRKARPFKPEDSPAIREYWRRCAQLLVQCSVLFGT